MALLRHVGAGITRYHLLVLPALALTALLAYLILANHRDARRLRDTLDGQMERETTQQARSLATFLDGHLAVVTDCAASPEVLAFHENRALGMSMAYGLRLSLSTIGERFTTLRERKRVGDAAAFLRLQLLDADGSLLVEIPTAGAAAAADGRPPRSADLPHTALTDDRRHVLFIAPVRHRGTPTGQVVAWMDAGLLGQLIGTGHQDHTATMIANRDGTAMALDDGSPLGLPERVLSDLPQRREWQDGEHRHLLIAAPVPGHPLLAAARRSSDRSFGSEPWHSLVVMSLLSAMLLGGSVLLVRHMVQSRELGMKMREMQVREQFEAERNRITLNREVEARRQAEDERTQLGWAIEQAAESVIITDTHGTILYVNPAFTATTGWPRDAALGQTLRLLLGDARDEDFYRTVWAELEAGRAWTGRLTTRCRDGRLIQEDATISPVRDGDGTIRRHVAVKRDVTRLVQMEEQLRQAQKLEAVGQLAAGIAHEINTPVQYVADNLTFLTTGFADLGRVLDLAEALAAQDATADGTLRRTLDEADVPYLRREIPLALAQGREGLGRVARIVQAMKDFSSTGSREVAPADLNAAIENTTIVARNEWRYQARLDLALDPLLPLVPLPAGDFHQALLHLLINAVQAIASRRHATGQPELGIIRIATRIDGGMVELTIADDGCGIPAEVLPRVFEPFFSTKPVGHGSGQGLAFVHGVVVQQLGGTVTCTSTLGVGTTFTVRLPHV